MQNRFKFRVWHKPLKQMHYNDFVITATGYVAKIYQQDDYMMKFNQQDLEFDKQCVLMQCTGLKDKNGKLIYEGDIIVIPNQYPFYCYKKEEDKKQDLNETNGEIRGESILNYIGIVEDIFNCWQYVYHCVNPAKRGMSEGINNTLNDCGFDKDENSVYEIIGNVYENHELLVGK